MLQLDGRIGALSLGFLICPVHMAQRRISFAEALAARQAGGTALARFANLLLDLLVLVEILQDQLKLRAVLVHLSILQFGGRR